MKIFLILAVIVIGVAVAVVGLGAINSDPQEPDETTEQAQEIIEELQREQAKLDEAIAKALPTDSPGSSPTATSW